MRAGRTSPSAAVVACGRVTPTPIDGTLSTSGFGSSEHVLPRKRGRVYLLDSSDDAELLGLTREGEVPQLGPDVVVLDSPDGSPPPGKVGYRLQGENLAVAALLQDGRRVFVRWDNGVYSTNVPELMGGSDDMFSVFG
jgi:hypothetical protein